MKITKKLIFSDGAFIEVAFNIGFKKRKAKTNFTEVKNKNIKPTLFMFFILIRFNIKTISNEKMAKKEINNGRG